MNDDITDSLAPDSQQLDAVDLLGGPRIFTVTKGEYRPGVEQPVTIHLAEFPRPWKPGKNMRRVIAYCWGKKPSAWAGRQVELYCDEEVTFGREKVSGTRISRISHIDGPKNAPIIKGQGKGGTWRVDPLPTAPTPQQPDARLARIGAGMNARGIVDREDMLAYVKDIIGRPIAAPIEMTGGEMDQVLAALAEPIGAPDA